VTREFQRGVDNTTRADRGVRAASSPRPTRGRKTGR
jgi:hypothetical protein